MSAMSNYLENKVIDAIFRGQAFPTLANLHFALYASDPTDAGGAGEFTAASYDRVQVTTGLTAFKSTQNDNLVSTGTGGNTTNSAPIAFPAPTENWGVASHIAIFDAATGGNLIAHGALGTAKTINANDPAPTFAAGVLSFTLA